MTEFNKAIIDDINKVSFTHLWVNNFGWETTVHLPSDFAEVEVFGMDEEPGILIFLGTSDKGGVRILKGTVI